MEHYTALLPTLRISVQVQVLDESICCVVIFIRCKNLNIFKLLRIGVFFIDFETIIEMYLKKECLLKKHFSDLRKNGLLRIVDLNLLEQVVQ